MITVSSELINWGWGWGGRDEKEELNKAKQPINTATGQQADAANQNSSHVNATGELQRPW